MTDVLLKDSGLIKLLPDQVPQVWPAIADRVAQSPGVDDPIDYRVNALAAILMEEADVLAYYQDNEMGAVLITTMIKNRFLRQATLMVTGWYAFQDLRPESFDEIFQGLQTFAKGWGMNEILVIVQDERFKTFLEAFNFDGTHYHMTKQVS